MNTVFGIAEYQTVHSIARQAKYLTYAYQYLMMVLENIMIVHIYM